MPESVKSQLLSTAGGRINCKQCQATSKRTKKQCRSPAMRNKSVCRIHGGKSTGPKTPAGKFHSSAPHTTYGHETRSMRKNRAATISELQQLTKLLS